MAQAAPAAGARGGVLVLGRRGGASPPASRGGFGRAAGRRRVSGVEVGSHDCHDVLEVRQPS